MRPLPDLDLARIAPLPIDQKRNALEALRLKRPPYSYNPGRKFQPDILNIEVGPLGSVPRASLEQVLEQVCRASKTPEEETANVLFAAALYRFATENELFGRKHEFFPLSVGVSEKVQYWVPGVVKLLGRPTVLFIDPRRSTRLTDVGRRFAFSVMHERIRAADADFANVELTIIQFDDRDKQKRVARPYFASGVELFSFETLDFMVRETYEIWREVLKEREREERPSRRSGEQGSLF